QNKPNADYSDWDASDGQADANAGQEEWQSDQDTSTDSPPAVPSASSFILHPSSFSTWVAVAGPERMAGAAEALSKRREADRLERKRQREENRREKAERLERKRRRVQAKPPEGPVGAAGT